MILLIAAVKRYVHVCHTCQLSLFWRDSPLFGAKFPTVSLFLTLSHFFMSPKCHKFCIFDPKLCYFSPFYPISHLFGDFVPLFGHDRLATMVCRCGCSYINMCTVMWKLCSLTVLQTETVPCSSIHTDRVRPAHQGQFYWVWLVKCGCEMCSCMCMSTKQLVVNAQD